MSKNSHTLESQWRDKINSDLKGKKKWDDFMYHIGNCAQISPFIHDTNAHSVSLSQFPNSWHSMLDLLSCREVEQKYMQSIGIDIFLNTSLPSTDKITYWRQLENSPHTIFDTRNTQFFQKNCKDECEERLHYILRCLNASNSISEVLHTICQQTHLILTQIYDSNKQKVLDPVSLIWSLKLGMGFYDNIVLLRSARILTSNIAKSWDIPLKSIKLLAYTTPTTTLKNTIQHQLIHQTAQTVSAVIGKSDYILMAPFIHGELHSHTSMRLAANIHHLLRMESHFSCVNDMVKGSYALDALTSKCAQSTWKKFLQSLSQ